MGLLWGAVALSPGVARAQPSDLFYERAVMSAADHSAAAGRDMNISASGGGVAAGTIHGDVSTGNPTNPGPERR